MKRFIKVLQPRYYTLDDEAQATDPEVSDETLGEGHHSISAAICPA